MGKWDVETRKKENILQVGTIRRSCRFRGTISRMKMDQRRSIFLRLAKGGRVSMVLRARKLDRSQRPGAPQIVASFLEARRVD